MGKVLPSSFERDIGSKVNYSHDTMKNTMNRFPGIASAISLLLLSVAGLGPGAIAQTAPTMALRVDRYDLSVRLSPDDARAEIQVTLQISNPSQQPANRLALRLGESVQVNSVQIDGQNWTYTESKDERTRTLGLSGDLGRPLPPRASIKVAMNYRFSAEIPSARSTIDWGESFLLPESLWVPLVHTPFIVDYNVDNAPFNLAVSGPSGIRTLAPGQVASTNGADGSVSYEADELLAPLFIAGDYELWGDKSAGIEIYIHRGYTLAQQATLVATQREAQRILDFYRELLGARTNKPIRIVASSQVPAYGSAGLLLMDERTFARKILDEETIAFMATNLARSWIGARLSIQGAGHGVLSDGLPSYLMSLYMEKAYGAEARMRAIERFQRGYLSLVSSGTAYDAPLGRQTLLNREYYTSIFNKVPMVLRLFEAQIGREKLVTALRGLLGRSPGSTLTLNDLQSVLTAASSASTVNPVFDQWINTVVLPDFAVGKPVQEKEGWSVNVANFGTGNAEVTVEVTLSNGERLTQKVKIESQGYGRAVFNVPSEPVSARVDPERLYLQANYANDRYPQSPTADQLVSQGTLALGRSDFKLAETRLREAIRIDPKNQQARAALARSLALTGRNEEALKEAEAALQQSPTSLSAYALANLARGDVALAANKAPDAVDYYRQAVFSYAEDVALLAARDSLIRAERAGSSPPPADGSVQSFVSRFDAAVSSGRPSTVKDLVNARTLKRFIAGVAFVKSWKTEILRAEKLDNARVLLDVSTRAATTDKDRAARALYLFRRHGESWLLDDIPVFVEK